MDKTTPIVYTPNGLAELSIYFEEDTYKSIYIICEGRQTFPTSQSGVVVPKLGLGKILAQEMPLLVGRTFVSLNFCIGTVRQRGLSVPLPFGNGN